MDSGKVKEDGLALVAGNTALAPDESVEQEPKERGRRRRRRRRVRARTVSVKRLSKAELRLGQLLYPETDYWKPRTRAECMEMERPCPFVSCKYHLYLDVKPRTGAIKLNFPDLEVWELEETCALDVAERGGETLEGVADVMNLTRERVRQIERVAMEKIMDAGLHLTLKEYHTD